MKKVGIVMGSKSDLPIVEKAIGVLQEYSVPFEVRVLSAHRCPAEASAFAASARESGFSVLIAAAGMAAHLAGALLQTLLFRSSVFPAVLPVLTVWTPCCPR